MENLTKTNNSNKNPSAKSNCNICKKQFTVRTLKKNNGSCSRCLKKNNPDTSNTDKKSDKVKKSSKSGKKLECPDCKNSYNEEVINKYGGKCYNCTRRKDNNSEYTHKPKPKQECPDCKILYNKDTLKKHGVCAKCNAIRLKSNPETLKNSDNDKIKNTKKLTKKVKVEEESKNEKEEQIDTEEENETEEQTDTEEENETEEQNDKNPSIMKIQNLDELKKQIELISFKYNSKNIPNLPNVSNENPVIPHLIMKKDTTKDTKKKVK